jgi:hypothetical protein
VDAGAGVATDGRAEERSGSPIQERRITDGAGKRGINPHQVLGLAGALPLLTSDHWYVAGKILEFRKLFYDSIVAIYGVYYPAAPLMLHHVLLIATHLCKYENDDLLSDVVVPMKSKFLKY